MREQRAIGGQWKTWFGITDSNKAVVIDQTSMDGFSPAQFNIKCAVIARQNALDDAAFLTRWLAAAQVKEQK